MTKKLHQINFKKNQYFVGEDRLTSEAQIIKAIKEKQQVTVTFVRDHKPVTEYLNVVKLPRKARQKS